MELKCVEHIVGGDLVSVELVLEETDEEGTHCRGRLSLPVREVDPVLACMALTYASILFTVPDSELPSIAPEVDPRLGAVVAESKAMGKKEADAEPVVK